jgi:hypothetical protein
VVHRMVHDFENHASTIHASSTADTKDGPYANEYMLSLIFTEDGSKVTNIEEFVDSRYSLEFFAELNSTT